MTSLDKPANSIPMPAKRSRTNTEARFQQAVLEIVARSGCVEVGINNVAQSAGADKVLIYRYFGDLNGLWQSVADSREWMPDPEAILAAQATSSDAGATLRAVAVAVRQYAEDDLVVRSLLSWRRAVSNPLTKRFNEEWDEFWQAVSSILSKGGDAENRLRWSAACKNLALLVEAETCGESPDNRCFEAISKGLQLPTGKTPRAEPETIQADTLPTNLL